MAAGDTAIVSYDAATKTLTVDIDPAATTANTMVTQITAQGMFTASLSTAADPGNDGTGMVAETGVVATSAGGNDEKVATPDTHPLETRGVFNTLIRLADAIRANNKLDIEDAVARLDEDHTRLNFSRAEIGARSNILEVMQTRIDNEVIELKGVVSEEIDVDLVQAISDLTARQASFQASLQSAAQSFRLSLLDFI